MLIKNIPFTKINWESLEIETHTGKTGMSQWQTFEQGNIRTRMVTYSRGYRSDHWCLRGHILIVLVGELSIDLKDGQSFVLYEGTGFFSGDDESNPHLVYSKTGAKVFIID